MTDVKESDSHDIIFILIYRCRPGQIKIVCVLNDYCLWARQQQKALDHSRDLGTATILHPYHPLYGQSFPILKIRKVDGQRRYSLRSEDDIFSVPESWITDTGQNAFSESYFDADTVKALLELAKLL